MEKILPQNKKQKISVNPNNLKTLLYLFHIALITPLSNWTLPQNSKIQTVIIIFWRSGYFSYPFPKYP